MANGLNKIIPLFLLLILSGCVTCTTSTTTTTAPSTTELTSKEELVESESKDGKLEIIKQIKKVNDDGSYTIGYEADDGSFKIESRDVLGNIKGTYGYLDEAGQIKRVSYSTSNTSEIIAKPESSVVQRIPKVNRTLSLTTRRPLYSPTTPLSGSGSSTSSTSASSVIQRLQKLRNGGGGASSTTTERPNYSEIVNMESEIGKTTPKPAHLTYSTPRVLLQGRPILRSTPATHTQTQKSEGQILRPEIVTARPTDIPLFKRLAFKHTLTGEGKVLADDVEVRGNILRRQLAQEKAQEFDPQQHVFTVQQSLGNDATDVYSSSVTTGTPRPLFTTTSRPRALLSTTTAPLIISRPTIRYPNNYQRNDLEDIESNTQEYQESTTTEAAITTPTPVPVVQIPANRPTPEPLVAIRHPFQRGTILVPLSQVQNRIIPEEQLRQIDDRQQQYNDQIEPRPVYVRRLPVPPPQFRPIPVQVDENGYIREVAQQPNAPPTPYPLPVPITPAPVQKYVNDPLENDIEQISPPVSTRDFQKLLQQLIIRQSRLERISELTNPRIHPEFYQPRFRPANNYRQPGPYFVQRVPQQEPHNGPVQFINEDLHQRQRQQAIIRQQQQQQQQQQQDYDYNQRQYTPNEQSYVPTRRVARLLQPGHNPRQEVNEEYLPPDVREMLLLRMLQLAINPALPLREEEMAESTTAVPQYKKIPVRNVEILGEENDDTDKRPARTKRYREPELEYYD